MASPFKVFRKNQKILLAIAGMMAMIAFVILPIFSMKQDMSRQGGASNPVVVTTSKYPALKQSDIQMMQARHQRIVGVFASMLSRSLGYDFQQCFQYLETRQFGGSKEEETVNRWLMAHKADELGIQVSDDSIRSYIKDQKGKLAEKDVEAIIKQQGGDAYTVQMFFDDLREEMKVLDFKTMFGVSISANTPAQRWDYYLRTHRQAKIECIPVKVEEFASAVEKPDDKVLKEYFEKYKGRLSRPDSPEPGFRVPHKIDVEFLMAEVDKFAVPETITDDEIQTYYEKDAKYYDKRNKQALDREAEEESAKKELKEQEEKDTAAKEAEKKASSENAKPAEGEKSMENGGQPAAPNDANKDGEKNVPPAQDNPAEKDVEKTSSLGNSSIHQVSLFAEENKEKTDQPKTDSTDAAAKLAEPSATEPKATDTNPTDAKPNETGGETPATDEATAKEPAAASTEKPESPKRQLTEEVRKEIRQRIAVDRILDVFKKIEALMNENAREQKRYDAAIIQKRTNVKEPAKLDFGALAKQYGLTAGKTGEKDKWEVETLDIGRSQPVEGGQPFFLGAFEALGKHSPVISQNAKGNFFLYWKTKDVKETAPEWKDEAVQSQVRAAWQLEQARKPALDRAKDLADKAQKSKNTLKEAFAGITDIQVVSPPAFSWLSNIYAFMPNQNPQYGLSRVEGVEMAGVDFMKAVFSLEPMGVATVMNEPKRIAYVIQVEKFEPKTDNMWENFTNPKKGNFSEYSDYAEAGIDDLRAANIAMLKQLNAEAGLKWLRKADQNAKDGSADNQPLPDQED